MKNVQILESSDIIHENDYMRPLQLQTENGGRSDYMALTNVYSGRPQNNVKWIKVSQYLGQCWWGRTVEDFHGKMYGHEYEFLRGDLPHTHVLVP